MILDLSFPLNFTRRGDNPGAFDLGRPERVSILSLADGASVAVDRLTIVPHGQCTHAESEAHIRKGVGEGEHPLFGLPLEMPCRVLLATAGEDGCVDEKTLSGAALGHDSCVLAVLIVVDDPRVPPEPKDYTGTHPPYLSPGLIECLFRAFPNLTVLLTNLPSVDPERDGGKLAAHHAFFGPSSSRRVIVELCRVDAKNEDVRRLAERRSAAGLQLQAIRMSGTDAVPVRPLLIWNV